MQTIMWLILGATLAAAAWVDYAKQRRINPPLAAPVVLDGISIQLPQGWEPQNLADEPGAVSLLHDPHFDDELIISIWRRGLTEMLGINSDWRSHGGREMGRIDIGDQPSKLFYQQEVVGDYSVMSRLVASRELPDGRILSIGLAVPLPSSISELDRERNLIRRIAASVTIPPANQ